MIPYGKHYISKQDVQDMIDFLKDCPMLTTGKKVTEFEQLFSEYTQIPYTLSCSNGTTALHVALRALSIKKEDEVLVPSITFVATSNVVLYEQGIPIFCDINESLLMDLSSMKEKTTEKTVGVIFVEYAGQPCPKEIEEYCKEKNLWLIVDGAHSVGRKGMRGDILTASFHPVKNMTTAEGGMVCTYQKPLYQTMKQLRNHGLTKEHYERDTYEYDVVQLGYNYRLSDLNCVLGISQIKQLPSFLEKRRNLLHYYIKKCNEYNIHTLSYKDCTAPHIFVVFLPYRDNIYQEMKEHGILCNVHYKPIYKFTYYKPYEQSQQSQQTCPNTERLYYKILTLPLYYECTYKDIDYVLDTLKSCKSFVPESFNNKGKEKNGVYT